MKDDVESLLEHSAFNINRLNFMLSSFLVNLSIEQNNHIKIFTKVAICIAPATLLAGIFKINFKLMPELDWQFGYFYALIIFNLLSLGTTLPEWMVNIGIIRTGKAKLAPGNILGSCTFNIFIIPIIASLFDPIHVPAALLGFALPVMVGCGILFYMLTADKRMSVYE